jgi:hypothetical protein
MSDSDAIFEQLPERITAGYGPTIKSGAIVNGSIAIGNDKGRRIQDFN